MSERLAGKVAIVTGAGSGLGEAIATAFHAEGASVALLDISGAETELAAKLPGAVPISADVSSEADVQRAVSTVWTRFGRIDVLVNNAGIDGAMAPIGDADTANFDRVIAINLRGVFLGIQQVVPRMLQGGGGSVITTSSVAGHIGFPGLTAYCASKAGVLGVTRAAALEYGKHGIRFNTISPGYIETPMAALQTEETLATLNAMTPLGRPGQPPEIAAAAVFLASSESSFITGTNLTVDGGYTAL